MKCLQKLTAITLLFLSTHNALQAGILDNLSEFVPERNKLVAYSAIAAPLIAGIGITFNINTDPPRTRYDKVNLINLIPWIPGIVRTAKKHPYATAGIASALGTSYMLYRNPEALQKIQEISDYNQIVQKVQEISNNHPALTDLAKRYLFNAAYATGVGLNFAILETNCINYHRKSHFGDVLATTTLPYIFGLYLYTTR